MSAIFKRFTGGKSQQEGREMCNLPKNAFSSRFPSSEKLDRSGVSYNLKVAILAAVGLFTFASCSGSGYNVTSNKPVATVAFEVQPGTIIPATPEQIVDARRIPVQFMFNTIERPENVTIGGRNYTEVTVGSVYVVLEDPQKDPKDPTRFVTKSVADYMVYDANKKVFRPRYTETSFDTVFLFFQTTPDGVFLYNKDYFKSEENPMFIGKIDDKPPRYVRQDSNARFNGGLGVYKTARVSNLLQNRQLDRDENGKYFLLFPVQDARKSYLPILDENSAIEVKNSVGILVPTPKMLIPVPEENLHVVAYPILKSIGFY